MNPILLKPKGEAVSQVVLLCRPYKDVQIRDYYMETDKLFAEAVAAFERLQRRFGNVVVEGAGGAAEVNLYDRDIANIRLALALRLPGLLVADIERGGVFAQVYGTLALLPEEIRSLVKGVIINKFRGDPALFESGVARLEELTGVWSSVWCHTPIYVFQARTLSRSTTGRGVAEKQSGSPSSGFHGSQTSPTSASLSGTLLLSMSRQENRLPATTASSFLTKNTVEDLNVLRGHGVGEGTRTFQGEGCPDHRDLRGIPDTREGYHR